MTHTVALGDTVIVGEHEYVVMRVDTFQDVKGRSATLHLTDPFVAERAMAELAQKKEMVEKALKALD